MRCSQTQKEHLTMLTTQLLGKEKLSIKWADLILFLVKRITHFIQPDLKTDGREMDIRHYVKIKKVLYLSLLLSLFIIYYFCLSVFCSFI